MKSFIPKKIRIFNAINVCNNTINHEIGKSLYFEWILEPNSRNIEFVI